jgi:hypothetical protein
MTSRLLIALPVALLTAAFFPASTPAQHHAMGMGPAHSSHSGPVSRINGNRGARRGRGSGAYYPYFWWDSDYGPDSYDESQEPSPGPPVNVTVNQPDKPPAPKPHAVESLVLENRDGQWVRLPTGMHVPVSPDYAPAQSSNSASAKSVAAREQAPQPPVKLPPAVLVFRDGHQEEVGKYVVQGNVLYTSADYWTTGSWTHKIPIADLDIPASVKLNAERGGKFSLPTRPNEVVVRF